MVLSEEILSFCLISTEITEYNIETDHKIYLHLIQLFFVSICSD